MGTVQPTVVQIASDADVDLLVERLPEMENESVVIAVQDDSTTLLTAAEFTRLLAAARSAKVNLSISTDDRLRRELARMLGWHLLDQLPEQAPDYEAEEGDTADLATYNPADYPARTNGHHVGTRAPASIRTGPGIAPRNGTPELQHGPSFPVASPAPTTQRGRPRRYVAHVRDEEADDGSATRRKVILATAIIAPVVVLAMVGVLLAYILPTATVTLVPTERTIAATLTYGLALPGTNYDITVTPEAISHTAVFEQTIPTTGERFEPDAPARGEVLFTNPTTQAIVVPRNTPLTGTNGVQYLTQEELNVPAADPFGALSFGFGTVEVRAAIPGPDGNTAASTVVGQLTSGVFYTNREAISGGNTKRIAVVSPADTAALADMAERDLTGRAEQEFMALITEPTRLVPGSLKVGDVKMEFSHEELVDATEISVRATLTVEGQTFDPSSLDEQARDEAGRRLAAEAGGGVILLGPSVEIGTPVPLNDEQTAFSIDAQGVVRSVITDEEREALIDSLVGKDLDEAEQLVAAMPNVARYRIEEQPSWLPSRMPPIASHIEVLVTSEEQFDEGA